MTTATNPATHCFREDGCDEHPSPTGPECCDCGALPAQHTGCDCEQPADPIQYAQLRAEIQHQMYERRHADAERHSEARRGAEIARAWRVIGHRFTGPAALADWTRITREDRAADYAGQPPTMPGPILAAGESASQQTSEA